MHQSNAYNLPQEVEALLGAAGEHHPNGSHRCRLELHRFGLSKVAAALEALHHVVGQPKSARKVGSVHTSSS